MVCSSMAFNLTGIHIWIAKIRPSGKMLYLLHIGIRAAVAQVAWCSLMRRLAVQLPLLLL